MRMVVHLLGRRSAQNDSKKGELEGALYVAFESTPTKDFTLGSTKKYTKM